MCRIRGNPAGEIGRESAIIDNLPRHPRLRCPTKRVDRLRALCGSITAAASSQEIGSAESEGCGATIVMARSA